MANAKTTLLLVELLKSFKDARDDGKMDAILKKAYAMEASYVTAMAEAKKIIAEGKATKDRIAEDMAALNRKDSDLRSRENTVGNQTQANLNFKAQLDQINVRLSEEAARQEAAQKKIEADQKAVSQQKAALLAFKTDLETREHALDAEYAEVEKLKEGVAAYEAQLRARAAELRKQTEGL